MIVKCIMCGIEFEAKRKDKKYCEPCKKKRKSMQVMLSRKRKHPEIEIGVGSDRAKNNLPGPTNQSWKTGIQGYRKLVDKKECAYCNSTENLLVHHLDHNRYNNELTNLIVICKKCHQAHHCIRDEKTGRFLANQNRGIKLES